MFNAICPTVYRQLRRRAGKTQEELGKELGVSRITVVRFENGRAQPDKEQEEKLKELAKCSDEEFVELLCKRVSELIGRRVGIYRGHAGYQPTTALALAYVLLDEAPDQLPPPVARALLDKIDTAQLLSMIFQRHNAELVELVSDCRDQMNRRRERIC